MATIFGETKIFLKIGMATLQRYPGFRNISIFVFCNFCAKIRKFKMAAIFGKIKFLDKIGMATLQRYPVGQKFRRDRSI